MVKEETRLQAEVAALLQQTEAADARDDATYGPDRRGDELPAEWARREQRLQTIRAAKAVLEQKAQAEATLKQAVLDARTASPRTAAAASQLGAPSEGPTELHRSREPHHAGLRGQGEFRAGV